MSMLLHSGNKDKLLLSDTIEYEEQPSAGKLSKGTMFASRMATRIQKSVTNGTNDNKTRPPFTISHGRFAYKRILYAWGILTIVLSIKYAVGQQDFEDLNKQFVNSAQNLPQISQQNAFHPSNRQPQQLHLQAANGASSSQAFPVSSSQTTSVGSRQSRPVLSNRFAATPVQTQASFSSSNIADHQLEANKQQPSNIELIMKNALARSAQLESVAVAESRQDTGPISGGSGSSGPENLRSAALNDKLMPPAERQNTSSTNTQAEDKEQQTTVAPINGHETQYSDPRFASLFARRNNVKKHKISPTEQIKAKPTLPSFIKTPPDPKQFAPSNGQAQEAGSRPSGAQLASSNFVSARLQQQQQSQGRLNLQPNQGAKPQKAAITSVTANNANNKRNNSLNNKQGSTQQPNNPRSASNSKTTSTTNKPIAPNNPFNKSHSNASDPASVIAMARKRLLANNALESGKLKQQQKITK